MTIGVRLVALGGLLASAVFWQSQSVSASTTVYGNGMAQLCSNAARAVAKTGRADAQSLAACDIALSDESLTVRDRAGTLVNRGVLRLVLVAFADAKQDFEAAVALMPDLGAAYTNRGAALIGLKRYADGIADIDRGLSLNTEEPEKAYFNRALADEALDDAKDAYLDYSQAARLKPDWDQPKAELARFAVVRQ
jgi:tetratricopeptide (TPR) repeat protein